MDDDEAIARSLKGDLAAYEALVARYSTLAHRTAAMLGAGDEAEDVVQEAFVKAFRHLASFRRDAPFKPWLLRIVTNETHNLTRSRGRRTDLALRLSATAPHPRARRPRRRRRRHRPPLPAARRRPRPARTGTSGRRLPVLLTAERGRDRAGARLARRHRQVQHPPGAGPAEGGGGR
ncbi:hypothetical protein GCM10020001_056730 [Nonomuraea salmonea]